LRGKPGTDVRRLLWRPLPQNALVLVFWEEPGRKTLIIRSGRRELLGGTVPLSEHEQRQLEQIEQALYAEHPRFAKAVRAADPQVHYRRRVVYAMIGFVTGLALLPVGVSTGFIAVSVLGFIVMLGSCYWAAISYRRMNGVPVGRVSIRDRGPRRREGKPARRSGTGFGERLEERWRRRQEGRGN
jgi:hypothetical protein